VLVQDSGARGEMVNVLRVFNDATGVVSAAFSFPFSLSTPSFLLLPPTTVAIARLSRGRPLACAQELTQRTGRNPNYQYVQIGCSKAAERLMLSWACKQIGKPFSSMGMLRSVVWPRRTDNTSFYCAELVAACLKVGGLMSPDSNPGNATPSSLYNLYKQRGALQANPYTLRNMNQTGSATGKQFQLGNYLSASNAYRSIPNGIVPPPSQKKFSFALQDHLCNHHHHHHHFGAPSPRSNSPPKQTFAVQNTASTASMRADKQRTSLSLNSLNMQKNRRV